MGKWHGVSYPVHYTVAAGFIQASLREERFYCNGEVTEVVAHRYLDWKTTLWDLQYTHDHPNIDYGRVERSPSRYHNGKNRWKFLGRIRDDADDRFIDEKARALVQEINDKGGYNYYMRNCRDFAYILYKRIKH